MQPGDTEISEQMHTWDSAPPPIDSQSSATRPPAAGAGPAPPELAGPLLPPSRLQSEVGAARRSLCWPGLELGSCREQERTHIWVTERRFSSELLSPGTARATGPLEVIPRGGSDPDSGTRRGETLPAYSTPTPGQGPQRGGGASAHFGGAEKSAF